MKILAIDSSGLTASAAVLQDGLMTAEYTVTHKKTHSQTLLPMIDTILQILEMDLQEIDAIAVAKGPGSFTGLRIGSATAKGLAFVLDTPIIPVPTVDALAYNLYGTEALICPLMDARRNQTYTGIYTFSRKQGCHEMEFEVLSEQKAVALEDILTEANQLAGDRGTGVTFLGDGVPIFKSQIEAQITVPFSFAPEHCSRQRAGAVGALGLLYYQKGRFEPAKAHVPEYLRLSQAEREREKKAFGRTGFRRGGNKIKNKMEYQIRALEKRDLIQVAALEQQIFSDPWSLKSLEDTLKWKENIYIIAEQNGKIIGYCGLWGVPPGGDICNVAVAPEYRRQKVGEALLIELLDRGRRAGLTEFTLEVRKSNQPARNLYQKLGFESAGIRKNFYDHPKEDAIIMCLVRSAQEA